MAKNNKSSQSDRNIKAFATTFLSIIGFVIAIIAWRDDKYIMFYARQSLNVFIAALIIWVLQELTIWIPVIGEVISLALGIISLVLWIFSWVYALSGKEKSVPVVGNIIKKI